MEVISILNERGFPLEASWKIGCYAFSPLEAIEKGYYELFACRFFYPLACQNNSEVWICASKFGAIAVLKELHVRNISGCNSYVIYEACGHGHLNVVLWLLEEGLGKTSSELFDYTASKGQLTVLKFLNSLGVCGSEYAMNGACEHGHLDVVVWLHTNCKEGCTVDAMNWAAENGHLDVVVWLHENRNEGCTEYAFDNAARNGHLEVVEWLHYYVGIGFTDSMFALVVGNRHLHIVKWLFKHISTRWHSANSAIDIAIFNGDTEMVKLLMNHCHRCPSIQAINAAAVMGHIEVVEWLHKTYGYNCNLKI